MDIVAETDIDWEMLQERFQNIWSTTALRRKWVRLKSRVDDFQNKAHRGMLKLPIHTILGSFDVGPRDHHSPSCALLFPSMMSDASGRKLGNDMGLAVIGSHPWGCHWGSF